MKPTMFKSTTKQKKTIWELPTNAEKDVEKECCQDDLSKICDLWDLIGNMYTYIKLDSSQIGSLHSDNKTTYQKHVGILQIWKIRAMYRCLMAVLLACEIAEQYLSICSGKENPEAGSQESQINHKDGVQIQMRWRSAKPWFSKSGMCETSTFNQTSDKNQKVQRTSTCAYMYILFSMIIFALATPASLQELNSTLPVGRKACPGDEIIFTCVTRGSQSIAWSSDEYIGAGGLQLEFLFNDNPGTIQQSFINPNATAILLEIIDGETTILRSQLNIIVSADFTTASISCFTSNAINRSTTSFSTLQDAPGVPQDVAAAEIPSEEHMCVVLVEWDPPIGSNADDIRHYIVQNTQGVTFTETLTLATFLTQGCLPNLRISVIAVDRCGRRGPSSVEIMPRLFDNGTDNAVTSGGANVHVTTPQMEMPTVQGSGINGTVALVIVCIILLVLGVMLIVLMALIFYRRIFCKVHKTTDDTSNTRHAIPLGRVSDDSGLGTVHMGSIGESHYGSEMEHVKNRLTEVDFLIEKMSEMDEKMKTLEQKIS